jgi:hypothetical protein
MRKLVVAVSVLVGASWTAAGCSSSDGATTGTSSAPTSTSSTITSSSSGPSGSPGPSSTTAEPSPSSTLTSTPTSTSTSTATAPTGGGEGRAEFVAAANALCTTMNDRSKALSDAFDDAPKDAASTADLLEENASLIEGVIADMRALPQPAGDEQVLATIYADVEELVDVGRLAADAARAGDDRGLAALLERGETVQEKANASSEAYGLTACAKS